MALVAMLVAVGWTGAASAAAQTVDDTNFGGGVTDANAEVIPPGDLVLSPSFDLSEEFDGGPAVPAGWESVPWEAGGTATVASDVLTVSGARANTTALFGPGRSMDFAATFTADVFQHVGFGVDFNEGPWAMFSTGGTALPVGLYARTRPSTAGAETNTPIPVNPLVEHDYSIEWGSTEVRFYVDGTEVARHATAITAQMRPVASDFNLAGGSAQVDYVDLYSYPATGSFASRVFDAGDSRATWRSLTPAADTPAGTGVSFAARTGRTPTPDASWTAFQPVAGGAVAGGVGHRYIQYRATLTSDGSTTPFLESVSLGYAVDTAGPATAIGGVNVNGRTARITFSSEAGATFQCSLDNRPFQLCSSPRDYSGLSVGRHTVHVRAIDRVGNVGPAAQRSFTVQSSQGPGPGGDNKPPRVRPTPRSVKVSESGRFKVRLRCPRDERRCWILLRVRYRGETIASKRVTMRGGRTVRVTLRLKPFARKLIETRPRWRVFALTTARDGAGNRFTTRTRMTLRAEGR